MFIKYLLLTLVSVTYVAVVQCNPRGRLCKQSECKKGSACKCYCSVQCGPRTIKEDDTLVYDASAIDKDGKKGICFCKEWDRDQYINRDCAVKEKQEQTGQ